MKKKIYPPIETSTVLTEDEMNNTLGGGSGCKQGCRDGCLEGCHPGNRGGVSQDVT